MPKVSILMPVYNVAPYVREAIDSVLNQSYTDFELIILDDCSPDNSAEIIDTYADSRIVRYKGEKNVGLANVLNVGFTLAKGEYIARMDSDDISTKERLAVQVNYLEQHKDIDLCSCGMKLFGAKEETWIRENDPEDVKLTALFYSPILHASSVWRKDAFDKFDLKFRQTMVPAEDYDMWTRALAAGLKLVNIPEVMYLYRIHPSQATGNTERTSAKDKEVKTNYLKTIYPEITDNFIERFLNIKEYTKNNVSEAEKVIAELFELNKKINFFDQNKLERKFNSYFQALIRTNLKENFSFSNFLKLNSKNKIKLFKEKFL